MSASNKLCSTCKIRGWETMSAVAACNCCEAPDYEFYINDSKEGETSHTEKPIQESKH